MKGTVNSTYSKRNPTPLPNTGATGYLNSSLQGLSSCDIFVKDMDITCQKYQLSVSTNFPYFIT